MKKVLGLFLIITACFILVGCNSDNDNKEQGEMTEEEIVNKMYETSSWLTSIWNNGINEIKWYASSGTNSVGQTADIEFIISQFEKEYNKKNDYISFIDSLNSKYEDYKTTFNKAIEQMDIIYSKVKENIPEPNAKLEYQENIDLFNQYFTAFYNDANALYLK